MELRFKSGPVDHTREMMANKLSKFASKIDDKLSTLSRQINRLSASVDRLMNQRLSSKAVGHTSSHGGDETPCQEELHSTYDCGGGHDGAFWGETSRSNPNQGPPCAPIPILCYQLKADGGAKDSVCVVDPPPHARVMAPMQASVGAEPVLVDLNRCLPSFPPLKRKGDMDQDFPAMAIA
ncbi:hypothetical protein PoB_000752900 [Plakobranchus ocellatus]|uniref:Uncharacterized protein n=1 Tax=Plakobranchus ocellatus TaxID=259542 RepID=A0AAV3YG56_9GAST|nr:hypothetical protein PoB_000752900 [Plakobranchus ocellatus]